MTAEPFAVVERGHASYQPHLMHFGVATARRAWLTADDVLNCLPRPEFLAHLPTRRPRI